MIISVLLDSCSLWPPQQKEKDAIDELFKLEDQDGFDKLEIVKPTEEELMQKLGKMPDKLRNRIDEMIVQLKPEISSDPKLAKEIKLLLFPNKPNLTLSDERDVSILFMAVKRHDSHFVTVNTNHFIGANKAKAIAIFEKYNIKVMMPSECLKEVLENFEWRKEHKKRIKFRDNARFNRDRIC